MTPAEIVQLLGTSTPDLSARLRQLQESWPESNPLLSGKFLYLAFRDGKPTIEELIDAAHARIVNFAIPAARIQEAREELADHPGALDPWVRLTTEARNLFIKTYEETGRSGEFGELLLYMLVEWILKAPIVACKMFLKTSMQMPVHGMDGIHIGCNGENLMMYWGESKMHADLSQALSAITTSVAQHSTSAESHQNEIRIIKSHLDETVLESETRTALKEYFNPYSESSNKIQDCYACLAGFDSNLYAKAAGKSPDEAEPTFRELYSTRAATAYTLVRGNIEAERLSSVRFIYFLVAFPSVDDARKRFQNKLWGRE